MPTQHSIAHTKRCKKLADKRQKKSLSLQGGKSSSFENWVMNNANRAAAERNAIELTRKSNRNRLSLHVDSVVRSVNLK